MKHTILSFFSFLLITAPAFTTPTSITDDVEYRRFSHLAAHHEALFVNFKQFPIIIRMYQHVTKHLGDQYLQVITTNYPSLLPAFDTFRENDSLGNPLLEDFGAFGAFSPTNLRYIKIAGDIQHCFGDLTGKRIIEIGVGYGGQCKILSDLFEYKEYILVDLPEVLELAKTHLKKLGVPNVTFLPPEQVPPQGHYDLVISNYAFSECRRDIQEDYLDTVLAHSDQGYLICNQTNDHIGQPSYTPDELKKELNKKGHSPQVAKENPNTDPRNFLIVWGDPQQLPPSTQ